MEADSKWCVALFVALTVGVTLALLRVERRWPHCLHLIFLGFLGLAVLTFAILAFELWLLERTGFYLHLHPYLLAFFGMLFVAIAVLAAVALLCGFCLRRLPDKTPT